MSEPFLGEIRLFGFNFAPRGWAFCQGQLLPIAQNTGGGQPHSIRDPFLGLNYCIALQGIFPSRN